MTFTFKPQSLSSYPVQFKLICFCNSIKKSITHRLNWLCVGVGSSTEESLAVAQILPGSLTCTLQHKVDNDRPVFNSKLRPEPQPGSVDPICCGSFHRGEPLQLVRASGAIIQIQDKHENLKILLKQRHYLGWGQKGPGELKTVKVTYFLEIWLPKSGGVEMPRAQTAGARVTVPGTDDWSRV